MKDAAGQQARGRTSATASRLRVATLRSAPSSSTPDAAACVLPPGPHRRWRIICIRPSAGAEVSTHKSQRVTVPVRGTAEGATMRIVIMALLALVAVGCKQAAGEDCGKPEDCATGLTCFQAAAKCLSPADIACRALRGCDFSGECAAKDGKCVAGSDDDCKAATTCTLMGRCHAGSGRCVATSDADCAASDACSSAGACHARDGFCVPTSDAECKRSSSCERAGNCTLKDGSCEPVTDEDCVIHRACISEGRGCTGKIGVCEKWIVQ